MKDVKVIAVIFLLMASCQSETTRPIDKDLLTEGEVLDFITRYDKTWDNRDTITMKEMMDDRYVYFTSTGNTTDRAAIINWFTPADKYKVDTAIRREIRVVHLKGSTAIVSSRWTGSGSFGDEKFSDDQRCGLVIQKLDGNLRIIEEHCTQIVN